MFNLTSSDPNEGELSSRKLFLPMEEVFPVDESDKHGARCLVRATLSLNFLCVIN